MTDARNNFVTDLEQKDFAVFEDGIRQELSLFTHENLPISMVLMIDTSASMEEKLGTAQAAADPLHRRPCGRRTWRRSSSSTTARRRCSPSRTTSPRSRRRSRRPRPRAPTALHNALYVALKDLMRDKKAAELRRRAIVLLSDGEDTASLVSDDQVLELAKKSEINIYAISLRPNRPQDRRARPSARPSTSSTR